MLQALEWFIGLGSTVFLPVIIIVIGLIFGVKLSKAFMAGITVGIGSIGLNLVIGLLTDGLGQAVQLMGERFGLALSIMDIGCGPGGPLAFSTSLGLMCILISIGLNLVFVLFGFTRTFNIDIWNFWFPIFLGLVTQAVTNDFAISIAALIVALMLQWLLADLFQERLSRFFNYPGIAITHLMALSGAVVALPINWLFDRIPVLNKLDADAETIQKKFGIFGDTVFIGFIIGAAVGILAGLDFGAIATLGVQTAAVMKIMPKMISMFMEGLMPISEAARKFTNKHLSGRVVNIGMDAALTVGHPTVMATSLLIVPISLLLAVVLPGNKVLPFGDLALYVFAICLMIPVFKGNLIRSILGCTLYMVAMLYLSTWLAPVVTDVFHIANFDVGSAGIISFVTSGLWPVALFVLVAEYVGMVGFVVLGICVLGGLIYKNKIHAVSQSAVGESEESL